MFYLTKTICAMVVSKHTPIPYTILWSTPLCQTRCCLQTSQSSPFLYHSTPLHSTIATDSHCRPSPSIVCLHHKKLLMFLLFIFVISPIYLFLNTNTPCIVDSPCRDSLCVYLLSLPFLYF